jgi:hypothetical protein
MRRRHQNPLRWLLAGTLLILAATHPETVGHMVQLGVGLLLAIVQGAADGAAANPGAAALTCLAAYIAHQIRTHQPRTARTH